MPREFGPVEETITQETIDRYAIATGDFNLVHISQEYAERTRFKGTIAHGVLVFTWARQLVAEAIGFDYERRGFLDQRFRFCVRPGDTIITFVKEEGGVYEIEIKNQGDVVVATGRAGLRD